MNPFLADIVLRQSLLIARPDSRICFCPFPFFNLGAHKTLLLILIVLINFRTLDYKLFNLSKKKKAAPRSSASVTLISYAKVKQRRKKKQIQEKKKTVKTEINLIDSLIIFSFYSKNFVLCPSRKFNAFNITCNKKFFFKQIPNR